MAQAISFHVRPRVTRIPSDTVTPVGLYLRARDLFPGSFLLESSDSRGPEHSFSYVCFHRLAHIEIDESAVTARLPDGTLEHSELQQHRDGFEALKAFFARFPAEKIPNDIPVVNGFFGFVGFDAVQIVDDITLKSPRPPGPSLPQISYSLFQYVLAISHFRDELYIIENVIEGAAPCPISDAIKQILSPKEFRPTTFHRTGAERLQRTRDEQEDLIRRIQKHIYRGDVFQIVPSRRFSQEFQGDDLLVYRALRSLNPSPFLFYFDCGAFRLFGSSPEAQLVTKEGRAFMSPIAGTYRRSGDEATDLKLAEQLLADPKENSEHVMLVDLARNDLSTCCYPVEVMELRSIQLYSHVIHLVSKVGGTMLPGFEPLDVLARTFPAGTLSGAPKFRAIELIDAFEGERRQWYGGCLGFFGFHGESLHAILIRTFLSDGGALTYQAGAGVVADSDARLETEEMDNKLMALRRALERAEEFSTGTELTRGAR